MFTIQQVCHLDNATSICGRISR